MCMYSDRTELTYCRIICGFFGRFFFELIGSRLRMIHITFELIFQLCTCNGSFNNTLQTFNYRRSGRCATEIFETFSITCFRIE